MALLPRGIPSAADIDLAGRYDSRTYNERAIRAAAILYFHADLLTLWHRRKAWFWQRYGWGLGAVERAVDEDILRYCRDA